ncbi:hypothetical protein OAO01_03440 [Oligoflexia bacterium]|nr:hypothetical protein [Oligoflexia bacterium]
MTTRKRVKLSFISILFFLTLLLPASASAGKFSRSLNAFCDVNISVVTNIPEIIGSIQDLILQLENFMVDLEAAIGDIGLGGKTCLSDVLGDIGFDFAGINTDDFNMCVDLAGLANFDFSSVCDMGWIEDLLGSLEIDDLCSGLNLEGKVDLFSGCLGDFLDFDIGEFLGGFQFGDLIEDQCFDFGFSIPDILNNLNNLLMSLEDIFANLDLGSFDFEVAIDFALDVEATFKLLCRGQGSAKGEKGFRRQALKNELCN